jgi:hypothetical protein
MQAILNLETEKTKATGGNQMAYESATKKLKYNTKKASMLRLFIKLGEHGLNCFEAANSHHDYVLRTTVSDLQLDYGLDFSKKWEQIPNAFGSKTDCVRYWLDELNKAKAIKLLGIKEAI